MNTPPTVKTVEQGISRIASKSITNPNNEFNRRMIRERIEDFLGDLKSQQRVADFGNVEVRTVVHTWTSLYPSKKNRVLAFIASRLFPHYASDQHWYHTVFPYKIKYGIVYDRDPETDNEIPGTEQAIYTATLITPHEDMLVDIYIQPATPVEYITLNAIIHKDHNVHFTENCD